MNDLVTNRQRFMVDNSAQWQSLLASRQATLLAAQQEIERKRLARETADAAKAKKVRNCKSMGCILQIDITTIALKNANEATWKNAMEKVVRCGPVLIIFWSLIGI